ncbi:MAG: cytochrome c [Rhodobiaceae bacterium]|nr:cytochrome c [Rhodobiaceae bacterium]
MGLMNRTMLAVAAACAMVSAPAFASGNAEQGAKVAAEHCARCHDISPDGKFKQYPPSFASIAVFRAEDQIRGRILYPPQHASMPQLGFVLTREEIDDLVAYIVSLDKGDAN